MALVECMRNYRCRWLARTQPVYAITCGNATFTAPVALHAAAPPVNAVLGFVCPGHARAVAREHGTAAAVVQESVAALADRAFMVRLPLAIVHSSWCDVDTHSTHFDIFFQPVNTEPSSYGQ